MAPPAYAGELPHALLPSIQKRVEASQLVCSAAILKTYSTSNMVEPGDERAAQRDQGTNSPL